MGKVLVVAPVWNEESKIGKVIDDVPRDVVDEVAVVDDGSQDNSVAEARKRGAIVISHPKNRGVGAAIRTGIEYALRQGFEVVVVVSGGGKTPGEQIPRLLQPIFERDYDFVQGSRYVEGGKRENLPLHRKVGTRGYSLLFAAFAGSSVTDGSSGFRAFKSSIFEDSRINIWQDWLDSYELEPYLYYKALQLGYRTIEVPVTIRYPDSVNGPISKMRWFSDWWKISRPLFYLGFGLKE